MYVGRAIIKLWRVQSTDTTVFPPQSTNRGRAIEIGWVYLPCQLELTLRTRW
jgi:hypothetical protein